MSARYRDLYAAARARLSQRLSQDEAERDARLLLAHAAGLSGAGLSACLNDLAAQNHITDFEAVVEARLTGQSVAHIMGKSAFMGLDFAVGAGIWPRGLIRKPW